MKKIKAVLLGCGDRGTRYAAYSLTAPEELEVIAAIDVNPLKLRQAKEKFSVPEDMLFSSLDEFLKQNIKCDVVINATMDNQHVPTSMALLNKGYNILLEKPVTADPKELIALEKKAKESNCKVIVCHVLRYTNFYSSIKKILEAGTIGEITSMTLSEHVWYGHFVNAYVRGKWKSAKECGSGLLLAKCCHDTDLMCWLNNKTVPAKVFSFGSRSQFAEKNAPEGSADFCYKCAVKDACMFDAEKFELKADFIPFYTWAGINKPLDSITTEEKEEFLRHDDFGRCVYRSGMDIVDRQCVSVEYENGSLATLEMVGGTSKAGRKIHLICTMGEIEGCVEDDYFILRVFNHDDYTYKEEKISCVNATADEKDNSIAGHYGGDYYIMHDLVRYLNGENVSTSITSLDDSINGHFVVYAAEESRNSGSVIGFKEYKENNK